MIAYQDFMTQVSGLMRGSVPQGYRNEAIYKSFAAAVAAANEWIEQSGVKVLNVETVTWFRMDHHFVRVWYETG